MLHGASVTDPTIFLKHAQLFENEFLEDMRALGVRDPDVLTSNVPLHFKWFNSK
jgi:hypothetical protein